MYERICLPKRCWIWKTHHCIHIKNIIWYKCVLILSYEASQRSKLLIKQKRWISEEYHCIRNYHINIILIRTNLDIYSKPKKQLVSSGENIRWYRWQEPIVVNSGLVLTRQFNSVTLTTNKKQNSRNSEIFCTLQNSFAVQKHSRVERDRLNHYIQKLTYFNITIHHKKTSYNHFKHYS